MKKTYILLLLLITYTAKAQEEELKLLEGTWLSETNSSQGERWWIQDGILVGESFMIQENGDTAIWEKLSISLQEPIYYEADVSHNPKPVRFYLKTKEKDNLVFGNVKHDFPQYIEYLFQDENTLRVKVYNSERKLIFRFKRSKD